MVFVRTNFTDSNYGTSGTTDPGLEPHQCLFTSTWMRTAWLLLSANKTAHSGLTPGGDTTRSPKQGYRWPHKKDGCPPIYLKESTIHWWIQALPGGLGDLQTQRWCHQSIIWSNSSGYCMDMKFNWGGVHPYWFAPFLIRQYHLKRIIHFSNTLTGSLCCADDPI